jgi:hypothetical protein
MEVFMINKELNDLVSMILLDARNGKQGLTSKYIPMFQDLIDMGKLQSKLDYIEGLQQQLDRVSATLEKAQGDIDSK